jgi:hypothetical protein
MSLKYSARCDTSVDTGLSGSDGHVRGVGDEGCSLHDTDWSLPSLLMVCEGGELFQDLSHFVSSLTASDVNDDLTELECFRQGLRNACLSASEGSRDGASSSQN